ncbi:bifunctional diguanylate cyclase/phosphodiesterase [Jannaschia donghaensis]|uniref:Bacteriophytochrome cph2 n=1 Tax=Jannaschia donghaensis TaxID=420998 RepID=A0A0M6YLU3_9RHOB|nr:bifunctional diguanylate cyclase/phosphodiesterase [Jannaschia donghaensis]CTQ50016.1 Bacteriophytochrome cph2 [Jannaschia donghaensis]
MAHQTGLWRHHSRKAAATIRRIDWMMLFPVAAALAWTLGQDAVAMVLVIVLPLFLALNLHGRPRVRAWLDIDTAKGQMVGRTATQAHIDAVLDDCARRRRTTAALHVEINDLLIADGGWGVDAEDKIMDRMVQRIGATLRGQDRVLRTGDRGMMVVLAPTRRADLDVLMGLVDRIQAAVAEPISVEGRSVRVHCCIGICSEAMAPARTGAAIMAAADCALRIARRQGNDAVRAFNADIQTQVEIDQTLTSQIEDALADGQIRPWFQPQVDTRTGRIAGFEALARWHHPELGVLSPAQFLGPIAATGRSADLGDVILRASILALIEWDRTGISVPCVGVNVSLEQLTDPRLAERILWQVDRHDIAPERIAIEILETVTLRDGDETIVRNINALRDAGFRLDLDDFGTGAASIAHIAQFGVHRIKIDRSFIQEIDRNARKRDVVAAILGLAERLSIETLAEGVETPEEQATLAEMGCPHVQGFGIAKPMPFEDTVIWANNRPVGQDDRLRLMRTQGSA